MPPLAANTVVSTAVTDLINAAVLLPLLFHMARVLPKEHPESRLWKQLMGLIALASFLGFLLHIRPWTTAPLTGIWIVLYAVLLEALHRFLLLSIHTYTGGNYPPKRASFFLRAAEAVILGALIFILLLGRNPIRVFILCGIILAICSFYLCARLAIRGHRGSRILMTALLPQIPGLALQLMRQVEFRLWTLDFNGIYHLCILVSIVIFYLAALNWNK